MNPFSMKPLPYGIALAAALGLICGSGGIASAAAPVAVSAQLLGPNHENVNSTYRISVSAGEFGAAVGLSYGLPSWPTAPRVSGSPMRIQSVRLLGQGSLRQAVVFVPKPKRKRYPHCVRGDTRPTGRYWLELPPNTTSTVDFQVTATFPRWSRTSYALTLGTFESEAHPFPEANLPVPKSAPLGPLGTYIQLRPASGAPSQRVGSSPEIVGRIVPPQRNRKVLLRAVRPTQQGAVLLSQWGAASSVSFGAVMTDKQGRFRVLSRPLRGSGEFAFLARTMTSGRFAADWNCGSFFELWPPQ